MQKKNPSKKLTSDSQWLTAMSLLNIGIEIFPLGSNIQNNEVSNDQELIQPGPKLRPQYTYSFLLAVKNICRHFQLYMLNAMLFSVIASRLFVPQT